MFPHGSVWCETSGFEKIPVGDHCFAQALAEKAHVGENQGIVGVVAKSLVKKEGGLMKVSRFNVNTSHQKPEPPGPGL